MTLQTIEQYGMGFQIKVLSAILTDKKFLQNINDILSDDYFQNSAHKWIVNETLKYFYKYNTTPTLEVLKTELKKIDNEVLQVSVKEQLREAYQSSNDDLIYVEEEFSNFCKNQQLKKALLNSVDLLKAGDYDSIRGMIDNALKAGQDKTIGHEYNKDVEARYRENHRSPVATPWSILNEALQGGLGGGDFGLIFGNPGGGKSWTLVALGGHAVKMGYNVVHYTLELGEDYVGRRYDAFFTNISVSNISEYKDAVQTVTYDLPGNLVIKEYSPGQATISTIESHIEKCRNLGFRPDLVIIDYVDLLSSKRRNIIDKKQEIDDIYISTKGLAKQLNLPIWSVSQVNRSGAKDNIIEGDKAAGSYDKMMVTDFALSLSRKKEDKVNGTGRFHVMKNRYGGDGMTYFAAVDTSTGHIDIQSEYDDEVHGSPSMSSEELTRKELAKKFFELNSK
jgi:replicative DNA helicase